MATRARRNNKLSGNPLNANEATLLPAYSDITVYTENMPISVLNTAFDVKYRLKIIIDKQTILLKAPPLQNVQNKAIFRIQNVLQDFVETDKSGFSDGANSSTFEGEDIDTNPHSIHKIDKFARNKSNYKRVSITSGHEFRETATSNLTVVDNLFTEVEFNIWNAVIQHSQGINKFTVTSFVLTNNTRKFLSLFPSQINIGEPTATNQKLRKNDFHTLAFFNGNIFESNESFLSSSFTEVNVSLITFRYFNAAGSQLYTTHIENTQLNGGTANTFLFETNRLLYVGCGPGNIKNSGINSTVINAINDNTITSYSVQAFSGTNAVSAEYFFDIVQDDCKGFETIRLAFLNSLGAYDYYNFTKKSTRKQEMVKSTFKQNYGEARSQSALENIFNFPFYHQGTYEGGTRTYNVNAVETIEANTDFITEDEAAILQELFYSVDVYMQNENGDFEPVVISETEYTKQTTANDKLIQYVLQIEKAHNTRVQRL